MSYSRQVNKYSLHVLALFAAMALGLAACGTPEETTPDPTATETEPGAPTAAEPTATPEPAFDVEGHFSGETVNVIVGFSPGGGFDTISRLVAQFLPDALPGNPQVIVTNEPGGAGLRGLQSTLRSEPDGLTITSIPPLHITRVLAGEEIEGFDLQTAVLVGNPTAAESADALYVRREVASSWDEVIALGRDITHGVTEPGHQGSAGVQMMEAVGAPIRNIYGYGGTSEIMAAFDRGEIDSTNNGSYNVVPALYPEWVDERFLVPVFYWGPDPREHEPEYMEWLEEIDAPLPPHMFDVWDFSEQEEELFLLLRAIQVGMNRTYILAPETPVEIRDAWRQALAEIVEDPEYIELAVTAGYEVGLGDPSEMDEHIQAGRELLQDPEMRELFTVLGGASN